jgi:hypothetical protein
MRPRDIYAQPRAQIIATKEFQARLYNAKQLSDPRFMFAAATIRRYGRGCTQRLDFVALRDALCNAEGLDSLRVTEELHRSGPIRAHMQRSIPTRRIFDSTTHPAGQFDSA